MDLINEAYNNNGSEKWINRDLCPRISSLEQVKDMIPNAYITRHDASKEITGVVVAKLCDDDVVDICSYFSSWINCDKKNILKQI